MQIPKNFDLDYLLNLDNEEDLYNEISHHFNEISRNFYAKANLDLVQHLKLKPDAKILDLACGTGYIGLQLVAKAPQGKMLGVDLSERMLAQGILDAQKMGLRNVEFLKKNIHDFLPTLKTGDYNVAVSCFALSYLGCDSLFRELYRILGAKGQIGFTTSSINCLTEWMPILGDFLMEHGEKASQFDIHEIPDLPLGAEDMQERLENAGFQGVKVTPKKIPLRFQNSREAATFLISSGWFSNYFFRVKDKKVRREIMEWALNKVDELHKDDAHVETSIEFLVAWNEPS